MMLMYVAGGRQWVTYMLSIHVRGTPNVLTHMDTRLIIIIISVCCHVGARTWGFPLVLLLFPRFAPTHPGPPPG